MTTTFDLTAIERETIERRRYRRVQIGLPVRWSNPNVAGGEWIAGETVNAGAGGVLVRSALPDGLAEGTAACMTIDVDGRMIAAVGEFAGVRSSAGADGVADLAFQFLAVSRTDLRALVHALVGREPV
jgi:hypothetical protein